MSFDPRDPRGLRHDAPLLDGWLRFMAQAQAGQLTPMSVPGHKQRQDLTGAVNVGDAPLYVGVDSIKYADVSRADAEWRAAQLWGADWCRFSVAGSTHGNQALALAVAAPGREIIVTRILHRSLLLGLVLAGLRPVWVRPEVDQQTGLPAAVAVPTVRAALREHPDACGVFLGEPSYVGTIGDLAGNAAAAHEAGVPLLVDAAWAAHLGFHPDLPPHAIAAGADGMVTSAHKALPAYSQGAIVLDRTEMLNGARLDRVRGNPHHQPGRLDHGQHRRRPGSPGPRRRGAMRAPAPGGRWGQGPAAPGARRRCARRVWRRADQACRADRRHWRVRLRDRG
jgi:arginine decarboxylase